jgi:hypothetical protein
VVAAKTETDTMPGTLIDDRLSTVVIPRKFFEAASKPDGFHHLPEAVVDYVSDVQRVGVYAPHELPARAMQVFHAECYIAEVNNGGHSQFIRTPMRCYRPLSPTHWTPWRQWARVPSTRY